MRLASCRHAPGARPRDTTGNGSCGSFGSCSAERRGSRPGRSRSVPKLGRSKSEMKLATCHTAGTSQIGRTLISRRSLGADGLAPWPRLGGWFRGQSTPRRERLSLLASWTARIGASVNGRATRQIRDASSNSSVAHRTRRRSGSASRSQG
jgi:hypothetical protein